MTLLPTQAQIDAALARLYGPLRWTDLLWLKPTVLTARRRRRGRDRARAEAEDRQAARLLADAYDLARAESRPHRDIRADFA